MEQGFSGHVLFDGIKPGHAFILAILAGMIAAFLGALLWMAVTVATGLHIGYVALAVGAFVGFTVRVTGNGSSPIYGLVGAAWTLVSCVTGEVLAAIQLQTNPQANFYTVFMHTNLIDLVTALATETTPMMYVIYGIGIFEGYMFSIRK